MAFHEQIIEIPSVQHFLKESEVEKDDEGMLLIEMNNYQAQLIEKFKQQQNKKLKSIVAEHSFLSKMYSKIKHRAQVKDARMKKQMQKNCVVDINGIQIMEHQFVDVFAPQGHMSDVIVEVLKSIWEKSWDDQMMLSMGAVVSAF